MPLGAAVAVLAMDPWKDNLRPGLLPLRSVLSLLLVATMAE